MAHVLVNAPKYKNNIDLLREYYDLVVDKYADTIKRMVDIGHRKNIKFTEVIARNFPEKEIVYYDNSESIQTLTNALKQGISKVMDFWGIKSYKEIPENVNFTSSPKGDFDAASYFFTIHEFYKEIHTKESLGKASRLLKSGGLIFVIDYNLDWLRQIEEENARNMFKEIFNSRNEKKVIENEKEWYEAHTHYSLEKCVSDAEHVGFKTLHHQPDIGEKSKLFFYIGVKY
jgi:hypothetical protein